MVSLLSQSSEMKVGELMLLALPFSRPHSPPFIMTVLQSECVSLEVMDVSVTPQLLLLSRSPSPLL